MSKEKLLVALGLGMLYCPTLEAQDEILFRDPIPLPDIINSESEELQPVFDKDSSHLYFVRMFHEDNVGGKESGDQDIWMAKHDADGNWTEVVHLEDLNNKYHNSIFGISDDGNTVYLMNAYIKNKKKALHKGVAVAEKKGEEKWEKKGHTLPIEDFELHGDHYSFFVSHSEDVMILADVGKNTLGQEDLYVSKKGPDGIWHSPIHLGPTINTSGFEISPFLSPNNDTLYFSSDGHGGLGEGDMFYSVRKDETWQNWTTPVNLGPKINSPNFDAYFIRSQNDCYFCSDREGNLQIYHTHVYIPPPPPIYFNVTASVDPTIPEGVDGSWTVGNLEPNFTYDRFVYYFEGDSTVLTDISTDENGEFKIGNKPEGKYYKIRAYFGRFTAICQEDATLTDPPAEPPPPPPPPPTAGFEDIVYFDLNSSWLRTDATNTLKELVPKIKAKSGYKITIVAHCDKRASNKYNEWLSKRRMERVKAYLVKNGISGSVITGEYKGEEEPIHNCEDCDETKHQENRRATIKVSFPSGA